MEIEADKPACRYSLMMMMMMMLLWQSGSPGQLCGHWLHVQRSWSTNTQN